MQHTFLTAETKTFFLLIQILPKPGKEVDVALDCSGVPAVIEMTIESPACEEKQQVGERVSVDVFSHLTSGREYARCHQGGSVAADVRLTAPIAISSLERVPDRGIVDSLSDLTALPREILAGKAEPIL